MGENKIYDVSFKCPFNCIISGSSGSGKTNKILEFLQNKDIICNEIFYKVHYFFSMWQPTYSEMKSRKLVDNFIQGIPDIDELMTMLDYNSSSSKSLSTSHQLLIFDDLLPEIVSRKDNLMSQLMTVFGHHKNLSIILVSQMLFKPGDYKYSILTENVHYLFLFKSPRNPSKIIHLAKQISPYDIEFIVKSYKEATKDAYSYILFDFRQSTPEEIRIRSKIFPSEGIMQVHMNEKNK